MAKKKIKGTVLFDGAHAQAKGFEANVESTEPAFPTANGDYMVHVENGVVTYAAMPTMPAFPTANGRYVLKVTNGVLAYELLPEAPEEA